jgi:hypothetical protein
MRQFEGSISTTGPQPNGDRGGWRKPKARSPFKDLHETDDLRILDYSGERAFRLFRLSGLGRPILHEPA